MHAAAVEQPVLCLCLRNKIRRAAVVIGAKTGRPCASRFLHHVHPLPRLKSPLGKSHRAAASQRR